MFTDCHGLKMTFNVGRLIAVCLRRSPPQEFWVPNAMGVRGGIEYGFSSTTTDREQALLFAGGGQLDDASTVFEMQMGMVDRGADLTWLSQVSVPPNCHLSAI